MLVSMFLVACSSKTSLKPEDPVLAEWFENSWHKAKVVAACGEAENAGYTVDFEDNFYDAAEGESATCYKTAAVIKNEPPKEGEVVAGDKVLGEWVTDTYYSATVEKVENGTYTLKYDDGYSQELKVDKLRAIPKVEEPVK